MLIVNNFNQNFKKKFNVKTHLIYNPLNKEEIKNKSKLNYKRNVFKKNKLRIINIARLTDQKDHLTLIKALNIVKKSIEFNLIIIGYGANQSIIQRKINYLNLQNM